MQASTLFVNKLKEIHSVAVGRSDAATAAVMRKSEQARHFRTEYSALASRLNRECIMPTLIRFAGAIPNVSGPQEANEKMDDDFDAYDSNCEIAPLTSPEKPVKLRVRIRPDAAGEGITVECEMTGKEAELFHDAADLKIDEIDEARLQKWVENSVADAYRRFCELYYPPNAM